jgi:hypothetical protein
MRGALVPRGIWINILTLWATGQATAARQQLALALPLALRSFIASSRGTREYVGELPRAVTRFRYSLSDASERALLEALEHEFVDAVVDDVINGVAQSLLLVELCLAQPHVSLNELVHSFPWESSLKRSVEWKRKHIADQLRSMIAAGVPLPETVVLTSHRRSIIILSRIHSQFGLRAHLALEMMDTGDWYGRSRKASQVNMALQRV